MLALKAFVTMTDQEETTTEGELLIKVRSSLAAVTATVSVRSVILVGQAAAGQAATPWMAEAVRVFEMEALKAFVTTIEPEETTTLGELEIDAETPFVTTTEPLLIITLGELLTETSNSLAAVTATESVRSVSLNVQAAAGQAGVP